MAQDMTDYNYEVAYSRGAPAGEYVVNVHMYRDRGSALPIPVKISVTLKHDDAKASKPLVTTNVMLRKMNQEVTTLRFRLDGDGQLVAGSLNSLFKGLRVAAVQ
jgi:hypothetical protein